MKSQVSPALAGVIIAIIVLVTGFVVWSRTGGAQKQALPPEAQAKLKALAGGSASGIPPNWRRGRGGMFGR